MVLHFKRGLTLIIFVFIQNVFGQTTEQIKKISAESNLKELNQLKQTYERQHLLEKQNAVRIAKALNFPLIIEEGGRYKELQKVLPNGTPIYYTTFNLDAAKSTRTNHLQTGGSLGLDLMGKYMTVRIWDAGIARITHQEFDGTGGQNRYSVGDSSTTLHYHSAHVAGTIMASGVVPRSKGMAPYGTAIGYDWNDDLSEATTAAAIGMLISSHSYGYDASEFGPNEMYIFGGYISDSRDWDELTFNAPYYLPVFAAGNDGTSSYNTQPLDGMSGYDKLTGSTTSKNTLVIANAQDASVNSNGDLISVAINSTSSQGPTDDYRIKPDLTGNGTSVYSIRENSDNAYLTLSGTSMATPNVSGTLALLQEHYDNLNSVFMRAATLKGLVLHTADDAGPNGPDAVWGWGLMNAKKAAETISQNGSESLIQEMSINNNQTITMDVTSDGISPLLASVSWTDRPGSANNGTVNLTTPVLINDLDIKVSKNNNSFYPWKLTGVTTNTKGVNNVDPFERVDISNASGTYTITITHKGGLVGGSQNFSLIVTGIIENTCELSVESAEPEVVCGSGSSQINAEGSAGTTQLRLYTSSAGGNPIDSTNGISGLLTSPVISETTTFYVAAANEDCESIRMAVVVDVKEPGPEISIEKINYPLNGGSCNFDYAKLSVSGAEGNGTIIYDDDGMSLPWSMSTTNSSRISAARSNTNKAGGTAQELKINRVGTINSSNSECVLYPYNDQGTAYRPFDASGFSSLNLQFKHKFEYRSLSGATRNIYVGVSTDGTTFNTVWSMENIAGNISPQTVNVDLSSYAGSPLIFISFRYFGDSAAFDNWFLDDFKIAGGNEPEITWSPITGLFTDQGLSTPYAGENAATVYAAPSQGQIYTATADTSPNSCSSTATVEVSDNSVKFLAENGNWGEGSNWSTNLVPTIKDCVKIPDGKFVTVNSELGLARSLTVESGGALVIENGQGLKVRDGITNNSGAENFVVESGGNLIQVLIKENIGAITVKRNFNFSAGRDQYNLVASPVLDYALQDLYQGSQSIKRFSEKNNKYVVDGNGLYPIGRGLALYEPGVNDVPSNSYTAEFVGVPNNKGSSMTLTNDYNGLNLVGNPYPSAISLVSLYDYNSSVITPTFYFWDNRGHTPQSNDDDFFATFNALSKTGVRAQGPKNAGYPVKKPTANTAVGAGFFVQATSAGKLYFRNAMRVKNAGVVDFFGKEIQQNNRYWLSFVSSDNVESNIAIVYFDEGSDRFGMEDSEPAAGSADLYSIADDHHLVIQGKKPFVKTDVVKLGIVVKTAGIQTISIDESEGIFKENQIIYLRDKLLGVTHDLTERPYKFEAEKGEYNNRFEIVYTDFELNQNFSSSNNIRIEKKDYNIVISSLNGNIEKIEIINLEGFPIYSKSGLSSQLYSVPVSFMKNQIVIVSVTTENGEIVNKKFVNK